MVSLDFVNRTSSTHSGGTIGTTNFPQVQSQQMPPAADTFTSELTKGFAPLDLSSPVSASTAPNQKTPQPENIAKKQVETTLAEFSKKLADIRTKQESSQLYFFPQNTAFLLTDFMNTGANRDLPGYTESPEKKFKSYIAGLLAAQAKETLRDNPYVQAVYANLDIRSADKQNPSDEEVEKFRFGDFQLTRKQAEEINKIVQNEAISDMDSELAKSVLDTVMTDTVA